MRLALPAFLLALLASASALAADPENTLYIDLKDNCRVVIEMRPDLAPKHVAQIKTLARAGKYDGIVFHRVIRASWPRPATRPAPARGGSELPNLPAEFTRTPLHARHRRHGAHQRPERRQLAVLHHASPTPPSSTANTPCSARSSSGMECVDKIKKGAAATARSQPRQDRSRMQRRG